MLDGLVMIQYHQDFYWSRTFSQFLFLVGPLMGVDPTVSQREIGYWVRDAKVIRDGRLG